MMAGLERARLETILEQIHHRRVGVVGDFVLDGYWYADMTRSHLSRETPHFPRPVVRESYGPGAGANVAQNLRALGVAELQQQCDANGANRRIPNRCESKRPTARGKNKRDDHQ